MGEEREVREPRRVNRDNSCKAYITSFLYRFWFSNWCWLSVASSLSLSRQLSDMTKKKGGMLVCEESEECLYGRHLSLHSTYSGCESTERKILQGQVMLPQDNRVFPCHDCEGEYPNKNTRKGEEHARYYSGLLKAQTGSLTRTRGSTRAAHAQGP